VWIHGLRAQKGASQIYVEDLPPFIESISFRLLADGDAGIVDQDVHATECVHCLIHQATNRGFIGNIDFDGAGSPSDAAAFALFSLLRPAITTDAPASRRLVAMPNPIPPLPPVTIATRPVSIPNPMRRGG
jgi:hypothetical protein